MEKFEACMMVENLGPEMKCEGSDSEDFFIPREKESDCFFMVMFSQLTQEVAYELLKFKRELDGGGKLVWMNESLALDSRNTVLIDEVDLE